MAYLFLTPPFTFNDTATLLYLSFSTSLLEQLALISFGLHGSDKQIKYDKEKQAPRPKIIFAC